MVHRSSEDIVSRRGLDGKVWEVHKFGGTSVQDAECFRNVTSILKEILDYGDDDDVDGATSMGGKGGTATTTTNLTVVLSAMGGKPKVTDLLFSAVEAAASRDDAEVERVLAIVCDKHFDCIDSLFSSKEEAGAGAETGSGPDDPRHGSRRHLKGVIRRGVSEIRDILKTVSLLKWRPDRVSELVSGYGELWSSQILTAWLNRCFERNAARGGGVFHRFVYLDARRVITIDEDEIEGGVVLWNECEEKLDDIYKVEWGVLMDDEKAPGNVDKEKVVMHFVVTGYVASNKDGVATTLQRDGSDYTAAIMGKLFNSTLIAIWTDVDGILSADPRRVPEALSIGDVSFDEAMELAYFGAKVIHAKTMQPAIVAVPPIPIYVKNTFRRTFPGTRIFTSSNTHTDRERCVCGFSSMEGMALINFEGSGMTGVVGIAKRLFGPIEDIGINIALIAQASSEHSITIATSAKDASRAKEVIEEEFRRELKHGRVSPVEIRSPCSVIAAVGDGMSSTTGVAGRFFSALGDAKINVLAISQGSSERNISAVVWTNDATRAIRAVHASFHLSHTAVRVGVAGTSEVGMELVRSLETQRCKLRNLLGIDVRVCAIAPVSCGREANTSLVVALKNLDEFGGADSITIAGYERAAQGANTDGAIAFEKRDSDVSIDVAEIVPGSDVSSLPGIVQSDDCAFSVIFDCTSDESVGNMHAGWLGAGIHVITANNTGLSGAKEARAAIKVAEAQRQNIEYRREVTVGGSLPVILQLKDLLNSGDEIHRIDGILSISLSFIMYRIAPPPGVSECDQFDRELYPLPQHGIDYSRPCSFSEAVKEATSLGLMEADPTQDLNNEYTARVLMVLAYELGIDTEFDVSTIQSSSDQLLGPADSYCDFVSTIDERMQERVASAAASGSVPRHISSIDLTKNTIEIKIKDVPTTHSFATTPPSCECVRFYTRMHRHHPRTIMGPSSGYESTASALIAELLHLMRGKVGPGARKLSRTESSKFSGATVSQQS